MPAQRPRYAPQEEQELMSQLWSPMLANDPEAFVMFVFPWGQKDTPLEHFSGPRAWQREVLRDIARHIRTNSAPDAVLQALLAAHAPPQQEEGADFLAGFHAPAFSGAA